MKYVIVFLVTHSNIINSEAIRLFHNKQHNIQSVLLQISLITNVQYLKSRYFVTFSAIKNKKTELLRFHCLMADSKPTTTRVHVCYCFTLLVRFTNFTSCSVLFHFHLSTFSFIDLLDYIVFIV
jgi:hypothetical protein